MKRSAFLMTVLALLGLPLLSRAQDDGSTTIRRFALIVGANDGGPDRVRLRYAGSDAEAVARVMQELGGLSAQDRLVIKDPDRAGLLSGFERLKGLIQKARRDGLRTEMLFYYSGHSDEEGLLLTGEHLAYSEVRAAIAAVPADVRIAVLDSCASGALTRIKGGKKLAPFLVDDSAQVKGYAFLTSSSEDENAQESERVGGSFFTHFLVSGLRGAADDSRDGRVSLNEAYRYAFNETLARTESTQGGPQHPAYDMQLSGSGDLVLTDLRGTSALLVIAPEIDGRVFIRDAAGVLVAEIRKPGGRTMTIGLEPGKYQVTVEQSASLRRGSVALTDGQETLLTLSSLESVTPDATVSRGDVTLPTAVGTSNAPLATAKAPEPERVGFRLSLTPGLSTNGWGRKSDDVIVSADFGLLGSRATEVRGAAFDGIFGLVDKDVRGSAIAGIFNITHGPLKGFQGGGIFTISGGEVRGAEMAGLFTIAHGDLIGLDLGGLFTITSGDVHTLDLGGIFTIVHGSVSGVQGGGLFDMTGGNVEGMQLAGLFNAAAGSLKGFQGSGLVGVAGGDLSGAQVSGLVNVAQGETRGAQISGLFNYGRKVKGTQIGLVNVATEEMDGAPIGLVSYAGDGLLALGLWGSDTSMLNLGLKMGSRYVHSILGGGVHPVGDNRYFSLFAGLGGHIDFDPFWVDLDLVHYYFQADYHWYGGDPDSVTKFQPTVGYRVIGELSIFLGPTLNFLYSDVRDDASLGYNFWTGDHDEYHMALYPGFIAGLQYEPHWGRLNSHE